MSDLTSFLLASLNGAKEPSASEAKARPVQQSNQEKHPLSTLKLPSIAETALLMAGVSTIEQLLELSGADILTLPGMDVVSAAEIKKRLKPYQAQYPPKREVTQPQVPKQGERDTATRALARTTRSDRTGIELERPLKVLDLPIGYIRALERYGIRSVGDLCSVTLQDLIDKYCMGTTAGKVIERAVERRGFKLAAASDSAISVVQPTGSSSQPTISEQSQVGLTNPHPEGPHKWLDLVFSSLSWLERALLISRYGLDGRGARSLAVAAALAGVFEDKAARMEMMATARLRNLQDSLRPLSTLYGGVIRGKGRACSAAELAEVVGHPDSRDGYDALAFTRFILSFCPGLVKVGDDRWHLADQLSIEVTPLALVDAPTARKAPAQAGASSATEIVKVHLSSVKRVEARLVALVVVLAAEVGCSVDFRKLKDFAEDAGLRLTKMASIDLELGANGIWLESGVPGELRMRSALTLVVASKDLPGKLPDLELLRDVLPKVGVFRKTTRGFSQIQVVRAIVGDSTPTKPISGAPPQSREAAGSERRVVQLGSISGQDTRLILLGIALAAERGGMLDVNLLADFAQGAGVRLPVPNAMLRSLARAGISCSQPAAGYIYATVGYRVVVNKADLPGRLTDLQFMRAVLPKIGAIKPCVGEKPPRSEVVLA